MVHYHQLFQCLGQLNGTELPPIMRTDSLDSSFPEMCPLCQENESEVVLLEGPGSPSFHVVSAGPLAILHWAGSNLGVPLSCHSLTFAWVGQWGSGLEWEGNPDIWLCNLTLHHGQPSTVPSPVSLLWTQLWRKFLILASEWTVVGLSTVLLSFPSTCNCKNKTIRHSSISPRSELSSWNQGHPDREWWKH